MRKKNRGWVKYVLGLGAVLLVVLLVLAVAEKPKTQRQEEIRSRVAPLEQERDRLIAKRDAMQQSFILQTNHPATEHLIFLELDSCLPAISRGIGACLPGKSLTSCWRRAGILA